MKAAAVAASYASTSVLSQGSKACSVINRPASIYMRRLTQQEWWELHLSPVQVQHEQLQCCTMRGQVTSQKGQLDRYHSLMGSSIKQLLLQPCFASPALFIFTCVCACAKFLLPDCCELIILLAHLQKCVAVVCAVLNSGVQNMGLLCTHHPAQSQCTDDV